MHSCVFVRYRKDKEVPLSDKEPNRAETDKLIVRNWSLFSSELE
jgi:hypothetical protein